MKSKAITTSLLLLFLAGFSLSESFAHAQSGKMETVGATVMTDYSKLAIALEQSGLKYQKADDNVWVISIQTEGKSPFVIRIVGEKEIIMFVVPVALAPEKFTPEMIAKLDELNSKYYFSKFVHDKAGVYIRIDTLLHSLDGLTIKAYVAALNAAVDKEGETLIALFPKKEAPAKGKTK